MSAVAAERLVVRFDALVAVDGVSLEIERGEVFGLLGPNGAGKTTTLRVLTTLLKPAAGSALVAGYDVGSDALAVRASIGYVPQALSADGGLTAAENLDFYARVTGVPRRERAGRIAAAVEAMELEPMLDRLARTFSGGMLRRLEIATALLNRPEVLFLDEPTVGLDPTARALVWERVHALRADAGTTVVVHHAPDGGGRAPLRPARDHGRGPDRRARDAVRAARAPRCPVAGGGLPGGHRPRDRRRREDQRCPRPAPRRPSPRVRPAVPSR